MCAFYIGALYLVRGGDQKKHRMNVLWRTDWVASHSHVGVFGDHTKCHSAILGRISYYDCLACWVARGSHPIRPTELPLSASMAIYAKSAAPIPGIAFMRYDVCVRLSICFRVPSRVRVVADLADVEQVPVVC